MIDALLLVIFILSSVAKVMSLCGILFAKRIKDKRQEGLYWAVFFFVAPSCLASGYALLEGLQ